MISERENLLKTLLHDTPDWPPIFTEGAAMVGYWGPNENGIRGQEVEPGFALDCFGCKWTREALPAPCMWDFVLDDISQWRERIVFPDQSLYDWPSFAARELADIPPDRLIVFHSDQGPFDRLCTLMGVEAALIAMLEEPEECAAFFQAVADCKIETVKAAARYYGADAFVFTDDVATAKGTFMRPEQYRDIIKPAHSRVLKAISEQGMIPIMHVCGDFRSILPDIIEMGAQAVFPSQPCAKIETLLPVYGDKLCFIGGYNSQGEMGRDTATEDVVRSEARRMVDDYATKKGFVAFPMVGIGLMDAGEVQRAIWFTDEYKKECQRRGLAK